MLSIATRVLDDREAAEATRKVDAFRAATATLNSQRVFTSVPQSHTHGPMLTAPCL